jgi:uncharacterized membrane protein YedE/YeeE
VISLTAHDWIMAAAGGGLIGLAAGGLMLAAGQIAGISGVFARALEGRVEALLLLAGLPLGAWLVNTALALPIPTAFVPPWRLVAAGILAGIGARIANGCTSGHAVCGIARLSVRSLVATLVFMAVGMITVALFGGAAP